MDFDGLSVDQAPPISAPVRFFLTAPLFAVLAGVLILFSDASVLSSRFSTESIVITHAITIGFLSFVMFGALVQMLPVLAGVRVSRVGLVSKISYIFMLFGTLFMIFGLWLNISKLILAAALFLGVGFLALIIPMLLAFKNVVNVTASIRAMITALVFAFLITLIGMHLLASYGIGKFSASHLLFANIHSVWAIFGFAGILIIGVAFHVLPMFYVAPRFKQFCKKRVVWLIVSGLLLWLVLNIFMESYATAAKIWIALFFWAFSTTVYLKLNARRRKVSDVTVWYWRSAAVFMTLGTFAWSINDFFDERYIVIVAILIGGGFIFSIMSGMLYKIVPFLVWFHLNAKGYMSIPTMNDMINKKLAIIQYILFLISLIGFIISFFISALLPLFALTFMASMLILEYNVIGPVLIYMKIIKTKPDFDMSMFTMKVEN
ncbi:MAG: hypothetical protein A2513_02020 [Sulfurimonas sp. RIFOXYD12_FULL_33_39]|uniref:hypothetical protein n=1 Tax=unclassified Sulfurimonas TaxID=2623549 RepID=UPI0008B30125|nr:MULTISPECIES: hypothetical protein [unclassified Sulfurimonas]OHE08771.1 MAG: hypothetical protein A2513_02020 [Sulfurimonas sp. RIFOXYD12_FULL_33_39]OHE14056.1 MAG: hypothetical protein A2530_03345 [Sulfurimonas sp. RIFOXYD2_FULL_34_21]DAB27537.1 MAG TPA: hypothetical protein CFH78_07365 [Sulfurimonas sp. UBA10385]